MLTREFEKINSRNDYKDLHKTKTYIYIYNSGLIQVLFNPFQSIDRTLI